eukprot:m.185606 g.185606  ORF g.185606 m.185606 type:complete len:123 (-) comp16686_c0_seq1:964-1332(-)
MSSSWNTAKEKEQRKTSIACTQTKRQKAKDKRQTPKRGKIFVQNSTMYSSTLFWFGVICLKLRHDLLQLYYLARCFNGHVARQLTSHKWPSFFYFFFLALVFFFSGKCGARTRLKPANGLSL